MAQCKKDRGNGQPREPALFQLYRHTFVPDTTAIAYPV